MKDSYRKLGEDLAKISQGRIPFTSNPNALYACFPVSFFIRARALVRASKRKKGGGK